MSVYLEKVNLSFKGQPVLTDFSLLIKKGRFNALMGPSGIGKTTVVNLLLGCIKVDSGQILGIEDEILSVVFQQDRLIESYSGLNNILLACKKNQLNKEKAIKFLNYAGLGEHMDKPVCELSGGMRRRVAILRAILREHTFLILDEPFKGLDENIRYKMMDLIFEQEENKTVLLITHNHYEAGYFNCIKNAMGGPD